MGKVPVLDVVVNGERFSLNLGDLTGVEERTFRLAVGAAPSDAAALVGMGMLGTLEFVAGIKWLIQRRENPKLKYDEVLETVTYDSIEQPEGEDEGPPDSGGQSSNDSPPSLTSTGSNPGS